MKSVRRHQAVAAVTIGSLHLLLVGGTLLRSGGGGESQAFLIALVDLPLVLLMRVAPGGSYVLYGSTTAYVLFFAIGGSILYAALAWFLVGLFFRR